MEVRALPLIAVLLVACGGDIGVTTSEASKCDGELQYSEGDVVDAPFDADGDGYYNAANPDCAATYPADALDCDDGDAAVNPGAAEVGCNGIDDDCSDDTPDDDDRDGDGYSACEDCDDDDDEVNPAQDERTCNDKDDDCDEETLDAPDEDEDGYTVCEDDCDDGDPEANPGLDEVLCNDKDDDCSEATPDAPDEDFDGISVCLDCDDHDDDVAPDLDEVCEDEIDNDCDGEVDEDCAVDWTDYWVLDSTASYSCVFGLVSINVSGLTVFHVDPVIQFASSGSAPGTMSGTVDSDGVFSASNTLAGTCTEEYAIAGQFVSETSFEATLTASFTPSYAGACYDCSDQVWSVVGSR